MGSKAMATSCLSEVRAGAGRDVFASARVRRLVAALSLLAALSAAGSRAADPNFPPMLPAGQDVVTDRSAAFLEPSSGLLGDVTIAKTPPTIDFLYYGEQNYPGNPWSVWGDGCVADGNYYSAIGDHLAPQGNAFVFEYDPTTTSLRTLVDVKKLLDLPMGHYAPGKIHSRIDAGRDGYLYFGTHRGSTRVTTDEYHYQGDWIIRHHPSTGETEIVAHAPVPKHCIPTSVLDPDRLIFYGGTAAGNRQDPIMFFAYDVANRCVRHAATGGPYRYLMLARSTGRVYYVNKDYGPLMRYDPESGEPPRCIEGRIGLRAATQETSDGFIYTVATRGDGTLFRFDTKTEEVDDLGSAAVAGATYITTIDADPSGRYLYYVPGAHGSSQRDGAPVVQYDVKTGRKKVLAFLHPFYQRKYGYTPLGTFSSAVSDDGSMLFITWNGNRGGPDRRGRMRFDTCALTVVHIPESERRTGSGGLP